MNALCECGIFCCLLRQCCCRRWCMDVDVLPHVVDSIRFLLNLFSLGVACFFLFFFEKMKIALPASKLLAVSWVGASWVRHSDKINREMKFAHAHAIFDAYLIFFDVINSGQCHIKCVKFRIQSKRCRQRARERGYSPVNFKMYTHTSNDALPWLCRHCDGTQQQTNELCNAKQVSPRNVRCYLKKNGSVGFNALTFVCILSSHS